MAMCTMATNAPLTLALTAATLSQHRGDVYKGYSSTRRIDVARGGVFDMELPPRISSISPRWGSLAGGTEITIKGIGFGNEPTGLSVVAAGEPCDVHTVTETAIYCRTPALNATVMALAAPPTPTSAVGSLASHVGERGVRWQYAATGDVLVPSFEAPWTATSSGDQVLEGWFEAPITGSVSFLLRRDATAALHWSGSAVAAKSIELAAISTAHSDAVTPDGAGARPQPILVELWKSPTWKCGAKT